MTQGSVGTTSRDVGRSLPAWSSVLVVVAHPDDESFGLGAVVDGFVRAGARVSVLCFTHGEASTLHGVDGDLAVVREGELEAAARALGIGSVRLLGYADGALERTPVDELAARVAESVEEQAADGLLVFDTTGVTGHPDHVRATEAAVRCAADRGLGVLAWTLPGAVADQLRAESGAPFAGAGEGLVDVVLDVDRERQRVAVTCHPSQAVPSSVLWRRLELLGDREHLRWLVPPA